MLPMSQSKRTHRRSSRIVLGSCSQEDSSRCLGSSYDRRDTVSPLLASRFRRRPQFICQVDLHLVLDVGEGESHAGTAANDSDKARVQRLEDNFDGSTRENLRHIILCRDVEDPFDEKATQASDGPTEVDAQPHVIIDDHRSTVPLYILSRQESSDSDVGLRGAAVKKPLARIPTCAIFHKLTTGRGVPHSFASAWRPDPSGVRFLLIGFVAAFLRQWPALPRLVVSDLVPSAWSKSLSTLVLDLLVCPCSARRQSATERAVLRHTCALY